MRMFTYDSFIRYDYYYLEMFKSVYILYNIDVIVYKSLCTRKANALCVRGCAVPGTRLGFSHAGLVELPPIYSAMNGSSS